MIFFDLLECFQLFVLGLELLLELSQFGVRGRATMKGFNSRTEQPIEFLSINLNELLHSFKLFFSFGFIFLLPGRVEFIQKLIVDTMIRVIGRRCWLLARFLLVVVLWWMVLLTASIIVRLGSLPGSFLFWWRGFHYILRRWRCRCRHGRTTVMIRPKKMRE